MIFYQYDKKRMLHVQILGVGLSLETPDGPIRKNMCRLVFEYYKLSESKQDRRGTLNVIVTKY